MAKAISYFFSNGTIITIIMYTTKNMVYIYTINDIVSMYYYAVV